ncbi:unnamed protein product, partial [Musa acuminata subsp. burmannicoides]
DRVRIFDETRSRRPIHHGFFFGVLQIFTRGRESRRRLRPRLPSALRSPPPVLRRRPDLHPASDFPSPSEGSRYGQVGINLVSTLKLQLMENLMEEVLAVLLLDARLEFLFLKKICNLNLIEGDQARAG